MMMIGLMSHPERDPHVATESHHEIVIPGHALARNEDVWLVGEHLHGDALRRRQAMSFGERDHEPVREDVFGDEVTVAHGRAYETDLDSILAEREGLILDVEFQDAKMHVRMPPAAHP